MINIEPYARHLLGEGYSVRALAKTLGVPERTLRYWLKEKGGVPVGVAEELELLLNMQMTILSDSIKEIRKQIELEAPV